MANARSEFPLGGDWGNVLAPQVRLSICNLAAYRVINKIAQQARERALKDRKQLRQSTFRLVKSTGDYLNRMAILHGNGVPVVV